MVSLSPTHRTHPLSRTRTARPTKASRQDRRRLLGQRGGLLLAFSPTPGERAWIRVDSDGRVAVLREGLDGMVDAGLTAAAVAQIEEGAASDRPLALRIAGATAREMLLAAAAQVWSVPISACRTTHGAVVNQRTNARIPFSKLAPLAALLPVPFLILR